MQKRFIALMAMFNETSACLHRYSSSYADFDPLKEALETLDEKIKVLEELARDVDRKKNGYAVEKRNKRKHMAALGDVMRTKVQCVYLASKDDVAFVNANITSSEILYKSSLAAALNAEIILDLAKEISEPDKIKFKISAQHIIDLEEAIKTYSNASVKVRSATVGRQTAGDILTEEIRRTAVFVRQDITTLMGTYMLNEPVFYREFLHSKSVINLPSRHAQVTGQVTDAVTQQPLPHVKVKITTIDKVYEDMTDFKGRYRMPVSPDLCDISYELPEYTTLVMEDVLVDRAERVKRNVRMKRE